MKSTRIKGNQLIFHLKNSQRVIVKAIKVSVNCYINIYIPVKGSWECISGI